jgi:hypothetical protein
MLGAGSGDAVEFECPECGAKFKTTEKEASKGLVRCPHGHEFAVMGMLGTSVGDGGTREPK